MLYFKSQIHLNYLDSKDMGQLRITGKHTLTHTHAHAHPYYRVLDCQTLTIILIKQ